MTSRARSTSSGKTPWQGTDAIDRRYHDIHNALASIYLDGVKGVSPNYGRHQTSQEAADRALEKGRDTVRWMQAQRPGPSAKARAYMTHMKTNLERLLHQAEEVRSGKHQKLTEADYKRMERESR